jgi:hypothetical protein
LIKESPLNVSLHEYLEEGSPTRIFKDRLKHLYLYHKFKGNKLVTKNFLKKQDFEKVVPKSFALPKVVYPHAINFALD